MNNLENLFSITKGAYHLRQLFIVINKKNRQYMPKEVLVFGGESSDDIVELNKLTIKP